LRVDKFPDCNYQSHYQAFGKQGHLTTEPTSQKRLGTALFYGIVLLLTYLVYRVVSPFLVPLAWAAVLVVVSYPVYEWLACRTDRTTGAVLSTLAITVVLIVPMLVVMVGFVRQGVVAVQSLQIQVANGHFAWINDVWARIQGWLPDAGSNDLGDTLRQYSEKAAEFVAARVGTVLKNGAVFIFHLGVTILAMFYFYRDGDSMVERLRQLLPFELAHRDRMLGDARSLIFASVTSSLVGATAHAVLGGAAFALTGIKAPIFWGVMMGFFSFVPLVGSALIWVPVSISLMVGGHHWVRGLLLLAFCGIIVGLVDNLIRPWLISGRARMSGLAVFIAVLGGISVFGLLGVVLGPIIVASAASILDLYAPPPSARNKGSLGDAKKAAGVLE
jgi:predicted PurR-regulated permease PerM